MLDNDKFSDETESVEGVFYAAKEILKSKLHGQNLVQGANTPIKVQESLSCRNNNSNSRHTYNKFCLA